MSKYKLRSEQEAVVVELEDNLKMAISIATAMFSLAASGREINDDAVCDELDRVGLLEELGGASEVMAIVDAMRTGICGCEKCSEKRRSETEVFDA